MKKIILCCLPWCGWADEVHWQSLDTAVFNQRIQQAQRAGLDWIKQPERYAFYLIDLSAFKQMSYDYQVDQVENPQKIQWRLQRQGLLDDAVQADIYQIEMQRDQNHWRVISAQKAWRCWRQNSPHFSNQTCP